MVAGYLYDFCEILACWKRVWWVVSSQFAETRAVWGSQSGRHGLNCLLDV